MRFKGFMGWDWEALEEVGRGGAWEGALGS